MRLPRGHPTAWQNGTPQSMQRAACWWRTSSASDRSTSYQSLIRSSTGRCSASTRGYFRNPRGSAMEHLLRGGRLVGADLFGLPQAFESPAVVDRHHLDELSGHDVPAVEDAPGLPASGVVPVAFDQLAQQHLV